MKQIIVIVVIANCELYNINLFSFLAFLSSILRNMTISRSSSIRTFRVSAVILGIALLLVRQFQLHRSVLMPQEYETARQNLPLAIENNSTTENNDTWKPVIHLITYGSNHSVYLKAAESLSKEANETGWFKSITVYTLQDIMHLEGASKFEAILKFSRGEGYWIWKFLLQQKKANEISQGEFILYVDSGFHFVRKNHDTLVSWAESMYDADRGIMLFPTGIENEWTTERIFNAFNVSRNDSYIKQSPHFAAYFQILRKCRDLEEHFALINSILDSDPFLITDCYNTESKQLNPSFRDSRHDQSILSLAYKLMGGSAVEVNPFFPRSKLSPAYLKRPRKPHNFKIYAAENEKWCLKKTNNTE